MAHTRGAKMQRTEEEARRWPETRGRPKVERSGNIVIITFTLNAIRDVESVIARELQGITTITDKLHLLLDFTNVEALNSIELGTLVTLHKQIGNAGGRLTLFNLNSQVFELFTVTHLDTLLNICRELAIPITTHSPCDGA
jgi:anti-anti-sigma factor